MRHAFLFAIPLVALGAQPVAPQAPMVVNVKLSSFKFSPKTIVLDHGRSYVLRFRNASKDGHDFSSPVFFAAAKVAADDRRSVMEGEVEVRPGQVHEVRLTAPAAPGRFKVKCTHSFHKMLGMSGTIIVR